MLAFGADHETIRFQNRAFHGGFFSLQPTQASSTKVTLKTSAESSKFLSGDYVAIYQTTSGDWHSYDLSAFGNTFAAVIAVQHAATLRAEQNWLEHSVAPTE